MKTHGLIILGMRVVQSSTAIAVHSDKIGFRQGLFRVRTSRIRAIDTISYFNEELRDAGAHERGAHLVRCTCN